ncbi:hypothetical protein H2200_008407 [Cladophialophora chaetospira]|uniref:Isochorismatase-like domain-containing protein n=1 Tax=Cladophialophora chaetospira TaxID=386627 RepID=A0AA38X646_9EURO|nr:hypothetical protein H2200_008407 [Cladophialophora chaetospira]
MGNAVLDPTDPTSPLSIGIHETALLLMDYQNMLQGRVGEGTWASITKIASQLRGWALEKNMVVFHCLIDTSPGVKPPAHTRTSTKWKAYEAAFAATPGLGREADVLAPWGLSPLEPTVVRTPGFVSALESHGLLEMLKVRGIKSLILGGISTSGCVLSTARAATDCGFIVTVAEDACFDPVPGLHGMLVTHVLPMSAHVATSREIRDAWLIL